MKAKIRTTGEIVDVKMTKWGMYGDATNMNRLYALHDIEIIEDTIENVNNIDWEHRRYEVAKEAMLRMIDPNVLTQSIVLWLLMRLNLRMHLLKN